ncbi:hypothetical protein ATE84_2845 [Aquimarina sp. MAR_2010_214]|uniref:hypothetical protein n=1 Tax=Aquimarina sp. MAR_2010_214 TaxID=1250026 RepID=UPI000C70254C|nr:hypothetical protein [Aquimarina sp. MAR_2010_214]PKV50779.1 hypothetical protein ATE84_2845 [Aquimarina sp. MAR_2010_214]
MKTPILTISLCLALLCIVSCKKETKTENFEAVEVARGDTSDFIEEVEEESEVKKKKKPTKKKKPAKKENATDDKALHIPGTFDTTNNSYSKKYIKDYERYVVNYKKAVEANDMDSFLKLSDASNDLSKQYNRLMSILPGEEIEKLSEYMQVKSEQLAELSSKM